MANFQVEILETISRVIDVEADTIDDAIDMVTKQYNDGEIELSGHIDAVYDYSVNEFTSD